MLSGARGEAGSVLFSLFWSVQGSLLSWCYLQLKSSDSAAKELAVDLMEKCECQCGMPQAGWGLGLYSVNARPLLTHSSRVSFLFF